MSALRFQPQGLIRRNPGHPLALNLVGGFLPTAKYEIVTGQQYGTLTSPPALVGTPTGISWSGSGSVTLPKAFGPQFGPAQITVIVIIQRFGTYAQYARVADNGSNNVTSGGWDIEASANGGLNFTAWNGGSPTNGTSVSVPLNTPTVLAYTNNGAVTRSYLNGNFVGQVTAAMTPATTGGPGPVTICADRTNGASSNVAMVLGLFVFNKVLSDAEVQRFASQPSNVWPLLAEGSSNSAYQSAITPAAAPSGAAAALSWAEIDDGMTVAAVATNRAFVAWAEANDTASIAALATDRGAMAWAESDDVPVISGVVTDRAAAAWTEADDVTAVAARATNRAAVTWAEANDSTTLAGTVLPNSSGGAAAAIAWTEASDVMTLAGALRDRGGVAWVEEDDTVALVAYSAMPAIVAASVRFHVLPRDLRTKITHFSN